MSKSTRSSSSAIAKPERVIKPLYKLDVSGKLIKLNIRTHPNRDSDKPDYKFYSGLLVVSDLEPLTSYLSEHGLDADYKPYWTSEKEYNNEKQVSHIVQFEISGKNLDTNALAELESLFQEREDVTVELKATVEHFTNKLGVDKSKCMLSLLPGTVRSYNPNDEPVVKPVTKKPKTSK